MGFESLDARALCGLNKRVNAGVDFSAALAAFRRRGIVVYGTFIFGLPGDDAERVQRTVRFAVRERLFLAAFAHLAPFPGTPLYADLEREGRLLHPHWWLSEAYRFGQPVAAPPSMSAEALDAHCHRSRRAFYAWPSILRRGLDLRANQRDPGTAAAFWSLNALLRREILQKRGLPLGVRERGP